MIDQYIEYVRLTEDNFTDIICCPGGLEVKDKEFRGELYKTIEWRKEMLKRGMRGFVAYKDGTARGFIEYMPAEVAPFPIEAPGSAVLMCYHYAAEKEEEHLPIEVEMIERVLDDTRNSYDGLVTLGWENPVHFPIDLLEEIGFETVEQDEYISLMWYDFGKGGTEPKMLCSDYTPKDLSNRGKISVELGYSSRCPYSIHNRATMDEVISELDTDNIDYIIHRIDTKEEAIRWAISSWNWDWLFINGKEVPGYKMRKEELKEKILKVHGCLD